MESKRSRAVHRFGGSNDESRNSTDGASLAGACPRRHVIVLNDRREGRVVAGRSKRGFVILVRPGRTPIEGAFAVRSRHRTFLPSPSRSSRTPQVPWTPRIGEQRAKSAYRGSPHRSDDDGFPAAVFPGRPGCFDPSVRGHAVSSVTCPRGTPPPSDKPRLTRSRLV